jgi:hypothetical protein
MDSWTTIADDDTFPYFAHWDAESAGAGDYDLRAILQNSSGVNCSSPATITVTVSSVSPDYTESDNSKSQSVSASSTSSIQSGDNDSNHSIQVSIPSGALSGDGSLDTTWTATGTYSGTLDGLGNLDAYAELSLSGSSLTSPATVRFEFPPDANTEALMIYRLDTGLNRWVPLTGRSINTTEGYIEADTTSFGAFALLEGFLQSTSTIQGWNIIGFPGIAHGTTPDEIFGDDVGTVYLQEYDEPTGAWVDASTLDPGKGYILWSDPPAAIDGYGSRLYGASLTNNLSYTPAQLWKGFQFASNPYTSTIQWDDVYDASTNISTNCWTWTGSDYQLQSYGTGVNLDPWTGFWVEATGAGASISFPRPGGESKMIAQETNPLTNPTEDNWRVQLSVNMGTMMDRYNYVGVGPSSADGLDPYDAKDLRTMLTSEYVLLYVPHPEWGASGFTEFAQDVRSATPDTQAWQVIIETDQSSGTARVSWPNAGMMPPAWSFTLKDDGTGAEYDLRTVDYCDITIDSATHSLTLEAERVDSAVDDWKLY